MWRKGNMDYNTNMADAIIEFRKEVYTNSGGHVLSIKLDEIPFNKLIHELSLSFDMKTFGVKTKKNKIVKIDFQGILIESV